VQVAPGNTKNRSQLHLEEDNSLLLLSKKTGGERKCGTERRARDERGKYGANCTKEAINFLKVIGRRKNSCVSTGKEERQECATTPTCGGKKKKGGLEERTRRQKKKAKKKKKKKRRKKQGKNKKIKKAGGNPLWYPCYSPGREEGKKNGLLS